jgi:asparagine synthase (glutamine-hydrolysing)
MCGILGLIGPRSCNAEAFGKALDVMASRGPDDRGLYEEPECLLGHRRLSILDLSSAGHQPMASADGRYVIVYNGEIYNFRDLRKPLEEEGAAFRSSSDTEVILALYAKESAACLPRFRGMFAIAIWDRVEKSLFLARDRMGIKPLYLWRSPGALAFASEVKAIRALPGGPSAIEARALAAFLAWGSVPEPQSLLEGVEALPPGTWALWREGILRTGAYWSLPEAAPAVHRRGEAIELLRPILREAVALRCISDAPLGAFLSGGVDSSSVVALMREAGQRDLRTFSISFPQTELDESPYALKVAEQFATRHTDVSVTEGMVRGELEGFFAAMDQPTCDGVNTYLVSKFARQGGLTVSLSGLGGDELFAGYPSFRRIRKAAPWLTRLPRLATRASGRAASLLGGRLTKLEALSLYGGSRGEAAPSAPACLYYGVRGLFMPSQIRRLLRPELASAAGTAWSPLAPYDGGAASLPSLRRPASSWDVLHATVAMELRAYMLNQLLRDSDVFGMAHSLEIRVPLIDHELVEAVFQIEPRLFFEGPAKGLLLDSLTSPLPRLCTHRPKMGFTFPFDAWMKAPWKSWFEERLMDGASSREAPFTPGALRALWRAYLDGKVHWSRPWSCLVLQQSLAA